MAQITIYLPNEVEKKARKAAKAAGKSVSRWIADEVKRSTHTGWSEGFLKAAGAFPDFPSLEEIRAGYGPESPRESFDE
jgi:hypothetical protein